MKEYITVEDADEVTYEIQRSRFIGSAFHVESEEEARAKLLKVKKKYFDARHNSSAWVLGADMAKQKSNDDGEPGGTAGNPILETIKKNGLTDTLVVVTRYFGGIKLGAGGLIRAYGHTAALALNEARQVKLLPFRRVEVVCDYAFLAATERFFREKGIRVENSDYAVDVTWKILLPPEEIEEATTALTDLTAGRIIIEPGEETLVKIPIERNK